jgi:CubicO group peptidase (beta-lactamase class C family)
MKRACLLVLTLALAAAPALAAPPDPDQLGRQIRAVLERHGVPGAGVALVAPDGAVWTGGFGVADRSDGRPVDAETVFRVGSISKSAVAAALLRLQEQGRLGLHERLRDLAPDVEWHNPFEGTDPLRLVHLLEHTSGFDDMHFNEFYNLRHPEDVPLKDALAINPRSRVSRWRPGERAAYSNAGYTLAGYVLERASGMPFDRAVRELVLRPLGMSTADFLLTPELERRLARGYGEGGHKPVPAHAIYQRPAGSLYSSPRELARMVQMLLGRGSLGGRQILRPDSIARMEVARTTAASRAGLGAGYGLGNYADVDLPVTVHGHDGGLDGFLSSYGYSPQHGFGFVVLLNSSHSIQALVELKLLLVRALCGKGAAVQPPAAPAQDPAAWTGTYRLVSHRNAILAFLEYPLAVVRVQSMDGRLYVRAISGGPAFELVPEGPNRFRLPWQSEASLVFFQQEDGRRVLAGALLYCVEVGPLSAYAPIVLLALALVLMRSATVFAWVWIPRSLFGRLRGNPYLIVRRLPLLAVLCLFYAFRLLAATPLWQLGTANLRTVGFCLLTWAFAILSAASLAMVLRSREWPVGRAVRLHSLAVSLACCGVALYLAAFGILGLRLWAW